MNEGTRRKRFCKDVAAGPRRPVGTAAAVVLSLPELWERILERQDGVAMSAYVDGDRAVRLGHLGMLGLKAEACMAVMGGACRAPKPLSFVYHEMRVDEEQREPGTVEQKQEQKGQQQQPHEAVQPLVFSADAAMAAARSGNVNELQWMAANEAVIEWGRVSMAAKYERLQIGRLLLSRGRCGGPFTSAVAVAAAAAGQVAVLQWLHESLSADAPPGLVLPLARRTVFVTDCMDEAAACGHIDAVRWLHEHRAEGCTTRAFDAAAAGGHAAVLRFLNERRGEGGTVAALNWAARNGHLAVVRWLHMHRPEGCTRDAGNWAARGGHLAVLRFLKTCRAEGVSADAFDFAAEAGHLDVLRFLRESYPDVRPTAYAMDRAAANGHLAVCEWLSTAFPVVRVSAVTTTVATVAATARRRREETTRAKKAANTAGSESNSLGDACGGCSSGLLPLAADDAAATTADIWTPPATFDAMDGAARNGHLDMVRWLHAHRREGCTVAAMDGAAANGHLEVLKFLKARRNEGCTTAAMDAAATNGQLAALQWLDQHTTQGCNAWAAHGAAARGRLDVLRWLRAASLSTGLLWQTDDGDVEGENGGGDDDEPDHALMDAAALGGHLDVLAWLQEHWDEGCSQEAVSLAAGAGHLAAVRWLVENRREPYNLPAAASLAAKNGHMAVVDFLLEVARAEDAVDTAAAVATG